jgi:hypothetical protein
MHRSTQFTNKALDVQFTKFETQTYRMHYKLTTANFVIPQVPLCAEATKTEHVL